MSSTKQVDRRRFLGAAAAVASGAAVSCASRDGDWRALRASEAATLTAICERLIPADRDPGAAWAGVARFIDIQLTGPYRKYKKLYRQGLIATDQVSRLRFGHRFANLGPTQQDDVLGALERGDVPEEVWAKPQPRRFFDMVLAHTMQGFYGDPRHGGNREAIAWRMLGLAVIPIRGRDQGTNS